MNYSNSSEMSTSSDVSSSSAEKNTFDVGVQTDCQEVSRSHGSTCVNINLTYQDRVSLWVQGSDDSSVSDNNNSVQCNARTSSEACRNSLQTEAHCNNNPVVIVSKEKVTLRINPGKHERRSSETATLYEDIEEAGEWMSREYLSSLRKYNNISSPPALPPRLYPSIRKSCEKIIKRKNLNHLLGIDQQMDLNILRNNNVNNSAIENLQESGRVRSRKDLTKFLGINDVKLRKRSARRYSDHRRRSRSIIDNILNATKHFKSVKDDQNWSESWSQFGGQDQGRLMETIIGMKKDATTRSVEEFDHFQTSQKIVGGNENGDKYGDLDKDLRVRTCRSGSFSSVTSSRSSSSHESLIEKSSLTRIFRKSSRRFSTSGVEMMESIRRKSALRRKYQSSLDDIPLESSYTDQEQSLIQDKSYVEEFIRQGMPVIPFDQPFLAFIDPKQEAVKTIPAKKRREDYVSMSDSLDTLIRLAKGELSSETTSSSPSTRSFSVSSSSPSSSEQSSSEEPIYMVMTKAGPRPEPTQPSINDYMDMDLVHSLANLSC